MRALLVLLTLTLSLLGCGDKNPSLPKISFTNTDITGLDYAQGFALTDHNGQARTLADFKGKVVLVFFGYTHCPDVCPTTLAEMAGVMQKLDKDAERLQVVFITLDPERDTPALLAGYVPAFHPSFLGMSGDRAATDKVIKDFKLFAQKIPSKDGKSYTIDHTAGSYVFDTQGHIRLFVRHGQGSEPVLHDVRALLKAG